MGRPTQKMLALAGEIHMLGLDAGVHSGQKFSDALTDFDKCFAYIGDHFDQLRRAWSKRGGQSEDRHESVCEPINDPPIIPDFDVWGPDADMMREYYGDDSNWRWDGL